MHNRVLRFYPSKRLFRFTMTVLSVLVLTSLVFVTILAQAPVRNTRSWTEPGGSGLTITFSVPETYESCTSPGDRIYTEGIPDNWSLLGDVKLYWATPSGQELIQTYSIRQNGDLDLTIDYPPASTWPDLSSIGNPLRELHIAVGILVMDATGTTVPWVGGDQQFAPGILGAGGQVWDVICPPFNLPTPTSTSIGPTPTNTPVRPTPTDTPVGPTPTNTPGTGTAALGDRVWNDTNGNGVQDIDEFGVSGVEVALLANCSDDTVLATTTTNVNGNYLFSNLAAGQYRVRFTLPSGFSGFSPQNEILDDDYDSDPNASGVTDCVTLATGEVNRTVDAGLIRGGPTSTPTNTITPQLGSIGDRVWRDDNSNGIQDPDEPGVPGVTVQLKDCNNNILRTTVTDGNGNYLFSGLAAGCYRVGIVPNGFTISPVNQGTDDSRDSDVDPTTAMTGNIDLSPGETDLTWDAGLIEEQLVCGLTVDQKCIVPPPPPSSNFNCSDAKPLDEVSMRWNGSQTVDVRAWKGEVGETLLTTITNVSPNEIVTVSGYAGSPNDVFWEIFVAGSGSKLGESTFHLSCSDDDMDGPEDCGTAQGNGKKNESGYLNLWQLEGLGGSGLRFSCTSTPETPADSCTLIAGGGSVCNGQKPRSLTFRYTGGSCADTTNPQEGKFECSGNPGSGAVSIVVLKDADKLSVSPSRVNIGDEFTISRNDSKELGSETQLRVGGQTLNIHTSCSKALNLGDVFGSLELVGSDGQRLDTTVTFSYLVENNGDALSNVTLEDSFGSVAGPFSLATGASRSFERETTIQDTITNLAFVQGFLADGQMCSDEDRTTVTVEPPVLTCEDGKPTALVFEFTGGSCSDTTNPQEGKLQCSGNPGSSPVSIVMLKDADKISVNPSSVSVGQRFVIARRDGNNFASETELRVGGQTLNIHTSCSKALNVGDVFGSLRLIQFVPEGFPVPNAATIETATSIFLPMIAK